MAPRAVIVGPPGSGKTSSGKALARELGVDFRDTDADVVTRSGRSIADIFATDGESAFRALEEESVRTALAEHEGVLALGGGAVLSETTRGMLHEHTVVFLNVGMAEGVRRTGLSSARPLLAGVNPRATYKALLDARLPIYRSAATLEIETDGHTAEAVARELARLLRGQAPTADPADSDA